MISKEKADYHFVCHFAGKETVLTCSAKKSECDSKASANEYAAIMAFDGRELLRLPISKANCKLYEVGEFAKILDIELGEKKSIEAKRTNKEKDEGTYSLRYDAIKEDILSHKILKGVIHNESHYECDDYEQNALLALSNALKTNSYAFLYMFVDNVNRKTWIGASPELLLTAQTKNNADCLYKTMALAGTKLSTDNTDWDTKNIEEHRIVCEHIESIISTVNPKNASSTPITTRIAGMVKHLCKEYTFETNKTFEQLCASLHPTPAVCGYPKEDALKTILKAEGSERGMYAGYIIVRMQDSANAYINIRCIEFDHNGGFVIHTGCGLTADSDKTAEREELRNKEKAIKEIFGVATPH